MSAKGTPLFDVAPDIRSPAPSVRSATSEAAADLIQNSPLRRRSHRLVMLVLAKEYPHGLSRERLAELTGLKESSLCARLSELVPVWVECLDGAAMSKARMQVNAYRLTRLGFERVRDAQTEEVRP